MQTMGDLSNLLAAEAIASKHFAEAPSLWSISPNDDQKPLATTCQLVGEYIFTSGNSTLPRQRGNRLIKILEKQLLIVRRH